MFGSSKRTSVGMDNLAAANEEPQKDGYLKCTRCDRSRPLKNLRSCTSCGEGTKVCIDLCEDQDCTETDKCEGGCRTCWDGHLPPARNLKKDHRQVSVEMILHFRKVMGIQISRNDAENFHDDDLDSKWISIREGPTGSGTPGGGGGGGRKQLVMNGRLLPSLAENSSGGTGAKFPSLVSFIGETGAGKSTLIRALITLSTSTSENGKVPMPVPAAQDSIAKPTSSDMHLYQDPGAAPENNYQTFPIFFIDSEGLHAGEETPVSQGAAVRRRVDYYKPEAPFDSPVETQSNGPYDTDVVDSVPGSQMSVGNQTRSSIVEGVFPRLLYTFSDVICFVVGNDQTLGRDVNSLIRWAHTGMSSSTNQAAMPILIIILNHVKNLSSKPEDPEKLTRYLMKSIEGLIDSDSYLQDLAEELDPSPGRQSLRTTEDLLLAFFSAVRVFPVYGLDTTAGGAPKVHSQCQKLHEQVYKDVVSIQSARQLARRQFDADQLSFLMERAIKHFSEGGTGPFNIYKQFGNPNPQPASTADHVEKFFHLTSDLAFQEEGGQARYLALGLVSDFIRRNRNYVFGEEDFLRAYDGHIRVGFKQYHETDQCTFRHRGIRCLKRRRFHGTIHQFDRGETFSMGNFSGPPIQQCWDVFFPGFSRAIRQTLSRASTEGMAGYLDFYSVFLEEVSPQVKPQNLYSSQTCLLCLSAVPVHQVPCKHAFCEECLRIRSNDKTVLELESCPLCQEHRSPLEEWPWVKFLKPATAGCRVLALDGGGIRGVVQLIILKMLETELDLGVPLARYFDLIVGTSIGGFLAVGLYEGKSIDQLTNEFVNLCTTTFSQPRIAIYNVPVAGGVTSWMLNAPKYDTGKFKNRLAAVLADGGARSLQDHRRPKNISTNVALIAVQQSNVKKTKLVTNYNRVNTGERFSILRRLNPDDDISCLEACLAAAATPGFFPPVQYWAYKLVGGGYSFSFPPEVAVAEAESIWPKSHLDALISIGTGIYKKSLPDDYDWSLERWKRILGPVRAKFDSNIMYENFASTCDVKMRHKVCRLNADFDLDPPAADEYKKIEALKKLVADDRGIRKDVAETKRRLYASLFYFYATARSYEYGSGYRIDGEIRCRLDEHDALQRLRGKVNCFGESYADDSSAGYIPLGSSTDWGVSIGKNGSLAFRCSLVSESLTEDFSIVAVLAPENSESGSPCLRPISGFPCSFADINLRQFDIEKVAQDPLQSFSTFSIVTSEKSKASADYSSIRLENKELLSNGQEVALLDRPGSVKE